MKNLFVTILSTLFLSSAVADSVYHNYGSLIQGRDSFSCEISNNTHRLGRVHKIRYSFLCQTPFGRRYEEISYFRCGSDFQNCDIEGGDFDAFPGPSNEICHSVINASCYFSYSFPEEQ